MKWLRISERCYKTMKATLNQHIHLRGRHKYVRGICTLSDIAFMSKVIMRYGKLNTRTYMNHCISFKGLKRYSMKLFSMVKRGDGLFKIAISLYTRRACKKNLKRLYMYRKGRRSWSLRGTLGVEQIASKTTASFKRGS